jgi:hypothetical protein
MLASLEQAVETSDESMVVDFSGSQRVLGSLRMKTLMLPVGLEASYSKESEGWAWTIQRGTEVIDAGQSYSERREDAVDCAQRSLDYIRMQILGRLAQRP